MTLVTAYAMDGSRAGMFRGTFSQLHGRAAVAEWADSMGWGWWKAKWQSNFAGNTLWRVDWPLKGRTYKVIIEKA